MSIDANVVNSAMVVVGLLSILIRPIRKRYWNHSKCWAADKAIMDFLNGTATVPFLCLGVSPFYPALIPLVTSSQGAMAVAGVIGSIFIFGEILSAGHDEKIV